MKAFLLSALILTTALVVSAQNEKPDIATPKRKFPTVEELKALPVDEREAKLKEIRKEQEKQQGATPESRMERLAEHQAAVQQRHQELLRKKKEGQPLSASEQKTLTELDKRATALKPKSTETKPAKTK